MLASQNFGMSDFIDNLYYQKNPTIVRSVKVTIINS